MQSNHGELQFGTCQVGTKAASLKLHQIGLARGVDDAVPHARCYVAYYSLLGWSGTQS